MGKPAFGVYDAIVTSPCALDGPAKTRQKAGYSVRVVFLVTFFGNGLNCKQRRDLAIVSKENPESRDSTSRLEAEYEDIVTGDLRNPQAARQASCGHDFDSH